MTWTLIGAAVLLGAAATQLVVLLYIYGRSRRRDVGLWAASWGLMTLFQIVAVLGHAAAGKVAPPHPLATIPVAVAVLLFSAGTYGMLEQRLPHWTWITVLVASVVAVVSSITGVVDPVVAAPISLATTAVLAAPSCQLLWAPIAAVGITGRIAGGFILAIGLHMGCYPLSLAFPAMAPFAYGVQTLLSIGLAAAVVSFYFFRLDNELEAYRQRIQGMQKMEALGRITGGIAHDFNNLLTVVLANTDETAKEVPKSLVDRLATTRMAAEQAAGLTRQLLTFGRQQPMQREPVDLGALILRVKGMLQSMVGEGIDLHVQVEDDGLWVQTDAMQMEQALFNLVLNARDATGHGGRIELRAGRADAEVSLQISDTGHGIDDEHAERIFEPFFSTKAVGEGTGLGLAVVHGVVTQSGGTIHFDSSPDGTTFSMKFPLTEAAAPAREPTPATAAIAAGSGGQRVLIVEDQSLVRETVVRVMQASGFDVRSAENGSAALQIADEGFVPDLLLSDVIMPGMTGPDLAAKLRQRWPNLTVLFTSGFPEHDQLPAVELPQSAPLLAKPFTPADLLVAVSQALAETPRER